jgi:hypothetical protein
MPTERRACAPRRRPPRLGQSAGPPRPRSRVGVLMGSIIRTWPSIDEDDETEKSDDDVDDSAIAFVNKHNNDDNMLRRPFIMEACKMKVNAWEPHQRPKASDEGLDVYRVAA